MLGTTQRRGVHEVREYHERRRRSILGSDEFLDSARGEEAE
jgi:hypothetical protein